MRQDELYDICCVSLIECTYVNTLLRCKILIWFLNTFYCLLKYFYCIISPRNIDRTGFKCNSVEAIICYFLNLSNNAMIPRPRSLLRYASANLYFNKYSGSFVLFRNYFCGTEKNSSTCKNSDHKDINKVLAMSTINNNTLAIAYFIFLNIFP